MSILTALLDAALGHFRTRDDLIEVVDEDIEYDALVDCARTRRRAAARIRRGLR